MSIKLTDVVQRYDGSTDFAEWCDKLELVASLQDIKDLTKFLPLFLTGGAFSVYKGLAVDVRADFTKMKSALMVAFSSDQFAAYEELQGRKLRSGETVDVYLSELTRVARLVDSGISEGFIKCAFLSGLPIEVRQQLRAACSVTTLKLSEVVERARALVNTGAVGFAARVEERARPAKKIGPIQRCNATGVVGLDT